jgi:hypothetical protein
VICRADQVDVVVIDDGVEESVRADIERAGPRCVVA